MSGKGGPDDDETVLDPRYLKGGASQPLSRPASPPPIDDDPTRMQPRAVSDEKTRTVMDSSEPSIVPTLIKDDSPAPRVAKDEATSASPAPTMVGGRPEPVSNPSVTVVEKPAPKPQTEKRAATSGKGRPRLGDDNEPSMYERIRDAAKRARNRQKHRQRVPTQAGVPISGGGIDWKIWLLIGLVVVSLVWQVARVVLNNLREADSVPVDPRARVIKKTVSDEW